MTVDIDSLYTVSDEQVARFASDGFIRLDADRPVDPDAITLPAYGVRVVGTR